MYSSVDRQSTFVGLQLRFAYYRPKRSFGQGNIFTPVCHSVHGGGVWVSQHALQVSPGGVGSPIFRGWVVSNFSGVGGLQFFRGGLQDTGIRSTFGRYASYWNAFLCISLIKTFDNFKIQGYGPFKMHNSRVYCCLHLVFASVDQG